MNPVLILPPDAMSKADIGKLRRNGFCVVVAKDPSLVKLMDPIPYSICSRTQIEAAAIHTTRYLLEKHNANVMYGSDVKAEFLKFLLPKSP